MKRFNITGTCRPDEHYMVDISDRVEIIRKMIAQGDYFCINRGRQYGKTTTLEAVATRLKDDYCIFSISFEGLDDKDFADASTSCATFLKILKRSSRANGSSMEIQEFLKTSVPLGQKEINATDFTDMVEELCTLSEKPIVVLIDEVDQASNNDGFIRFLGILRNMFLSREKFKTFQSVILAGVHDIKNLKLKMRSEGEHQYNSPWNIAVPFTIDMGLPKEGIAQMLEEYESDHHTGINTAQVASSIWDYTNGYPFLVSRLCMLMDERKDWSQEGFLNAVKVIQHEKNTLFDDLSKKLNQFPEMKRMLFRILYNGESIPFNNAEKYMELAAMFGIIRSDDTTVTISNRIFETYLYELFVSEQIAAGSTLYDRSSASKPEFIKNNALDMELILARFAESFNEIYSGNDERFVENEGRRYFMLFTKPIINGVGHYYVESQTRDLSRTDLIIDYLGHQYIIEMKIWRGNAYNERGEKQLADYMEYYHTKKAYLLSFCFNKNKKIGLKEPVQLGDRTLIEAIV